MAGEPPSAGGICAIVGTDVDAVDEWIDSVRDVGVRPAHVDRHGHHTLSLEMHHRHVVGSTTRTIVVFNAFR